MEASTRPLNLPNPPPQPNLDKIKQKLLKQGVFPTPRILHNLRKKELQKSNRRLAKQASKMPPPLTGSQQKEITEESHFQLIKSEFRTFTKKSIGNEKMVGKPWERFEMLRLRELASENIEYDGDRLNFEPLRELSDVMESERDKFSWLLDNDIEHDDGLFENDGKRWEPPKRTETEAIKLLITRLSATELSVKDWKFTRMMRYSGLQFTERQMLKIVEGLGEKVQWRHAISVVEWVYNSKEHKHFKSRFVYTKLLKVLGRARKPREALKIFNLMSEDAHIYPDMAAYHSLAVTLGQAGFIKELMNIVESMKKRPKMIRNMRRKNWNPELQPDIVIFNAVLNACVQTRQWKGVSWVFQELRKNGLRPNSASYGLAMEVMLKSGKYDLVHEFFGKMKRNGEGLKALTYKVLVKAFWEEGKVDDAVQAVRDMERRGVIGTASVYYELARCLCFYGRLEDALFEIKNLKKLSPSKSLAVTFTGMIMSSMEGGHVQNCVLLYEHTKTLVPPNIGLINSMLKVYGRSDMFIKAKELFEEMRRCNLQYENGRHSFVKADVYTFSSMLEASASALQWEYFEYIYKEMTLCGYQIDQRKHSALLIQASKAGKCHLLEHAFNSFLESGEIPHLSIFTEMTCQAIIRHDYERAVNIVNAMAHAPFRVGFQDWVNLFERNSNVIDKTSLSELQSKLVGRDLVNEATVFNLSRALQFICEPREKSVNSSISTCPTMDKNPKDRLGEGDIPLNTTRDIREGISVNTVRYSYMNEGRLEEDEEVSGLFQHRNEENLGACRARPDQHFDYDLVSRSSRSDSDDENIEFENIEGESDDFNFEHKIRSSEIDGSCKSDTPSAYEILEIWKKTQ